MTEPAPDTAAAPGKQPLSAPAAAVINHLLRGASWARERLKPFCGKTAQFTFAPFTIALTITDTGQVGPAATDACDAAFIVTPGAALRLLAADKNAWQNVQTSGDTELAREILFVWQNLRWDVEEDLSRVFGDIVAHRMVQTGTDLRRWQQQTTDHLARSLAAYWAEEQPLLATRTDVEHFNREVDTLRDDVARIEQRIARLSQARAVTPDA